MPLELGDGMTAMVVLSECLTEGTLAIVEYSLAPRSGTSFHSHSKEDEHVYVLEGDILFTVGDRSEVVRPGGTIVKPRGIAHATRNVGPATARYLTVLLPGGFDRYLELVSDLARSPLGAPREALDDLATRYGLTHFHEKGSDRWLTQ